MTNSAWHTAIQKGGITDFRFHHLRHTWASWHRQAGTSCDELKDLGGWKSRVMVDREVWNDLTAAAARIERRRAKNVISSSRFSHGPEKKRVSNQR
jgi:integrase